MAITTSAFYEDAGSSPFYTKKDLIDQLESALSWAGHHGAAISGLVIDIDSYSGGGTASGFGNTDFYDCFATTSGSGSGASFNVARSSGGAIEKVVVNRPGSGYAENESLTISAADIGGSSEGATNITFNANVMGGATPTEFGSTTTWFDKDTNGTYPWGVARRVIESGKTFGDTYTGFKSKSTTEVRIYDGSSFHPTNSDDTADRQHGYGNSWRGTPYFDTGSSVYLDGGYYSSQITDSSSTNPTGQLLEEITVSGGTDKALELNTFKSGIDTNFVVFNYTQHTRSSTSISDNNYATFILHDFTSSLWDYDYLYLGGFTEVIPVNSGDSSLAEIKFRTHYGPQNAKRSALWGYSNFGAITGYYDTTYKSAFSDSASADYDNFFYVRTANTSRGGDGGSTNRSSLGYGVNALDSNVHYNAVVKGIPLNAKLAPAPYYIPDDFVLINFEYHTTDTNIQQGDTITVSGSEVYTVICAAYDYQDNIGFTRGIAFCGRTT